MEAAGDLKNLLERSPEYASHVQGIALTAAFNARLAAGPEAVSALARMGNEADLLQVQKDSARSSARALLNLYLAEADLQRRSPFSGLDALVRAEKLMQQDPPSTRLKEALDCATSTSLP